MFFTKLGFGLAWLLVVIGALTLLTGYALRLSETQFAAEILQGRSVRSLIRSGEVWLTIGVAFGIASEISRAVAKKSDSK